MSSPHLPAWPGTRAFRPTLRPPPQRSRRCPSVLWPLTQWHRPTRRLFRRLENPSSQRTLASAHRRRMVHLCRRFRSRLHSGTTRRRGTRHLLRTPHRQAPLGACRQNQIHPVAGRRRPPRHPDSASRPRLRLRCHRPAQLPRCQHRKPHLATLRPQRKQPRKHRMGSQLLTPDRWRPCHRHRRQSAWPRPLCLPSGNRHPCLEIRRRPSQLRLAHPRDSGRQTTHPEQ